MGKCVHVCMSTIACMSASVFMLLVCDYFLSTELLYTGHHVTMLCIRQHGSAVYVEIAVVVCVL